MDSEGFEPPKPKRRVYSPVRLSDVVGYPGTHPRDRSGVKRVCADYPDTACSGHLV